MLLLNEEFFVTIESRHTFSQEFSLRALAHPIIKGILGIASADKLFFSKKDKQETPKHSNHRIENFVDYCFEHLLNSQISEPVSVLQHLLRSIEEEENMRCSRLVYEVDLESDRPQIDWVDLNNPTQSMRKICLRSLSKGLSHEVERFQLEFEQWQKVASITGQVLPQLNPLLLEKSSEIVSNSLTAVLRKSGFKPASVQQTALLGRLPKVEAENKAASFDQSTCWVGPAQTYCMPPSDVHGFETSVIAIAQPYFDLKQSRLFVLQTQVISKISSSKLKSFFTFEATEAPTQSDEQSIMNSVIELSDCYADHLQEIYKIIKAMNKVPHENTKQETNLRQMEMYAQLFYDLMNCCLDQKDNPALRELLSDFFYEVIFKGLKNPSYQLKAQTAQSIFQMYYQRIIQVKKRKAVNSSNKDGSTTTKSGASLLEMGFKPAGTNPVSISGCVLGGVIKSPLNHAAKMSGLKPEQLFKLNNQELTRVVGKKKAKEFKKGVCRMCGVKGLVRDGLCLGCLLLSGEKLAENIIEENSNEAFGIIEANPDSQDLARSPLPRVSIQDIINGVDTRIARRSASLS